MREIGACAACETRAGGVCTTTCADGELCCEAAGSAVCAACCADSDRGAGTLCAAGTCVPACATDAVDLLGLGSVAAAALVAARRVRPKSSPAND